MICTRAGHHVCRDRCSDKSTCRRHALALEALTAKHRPPLCGLERHRRLNAARRAFGARLRAPNTSRSRSRTSLQADTGSFGLTGLTALRVVLELFVEKKELFP